jgi:hypothetical protein
MQQQQDTQHRSPAIDTTVPIGNQRLSKAPVGMEYADVRNRFTYHPPNDEQIQKYEQLRTGAGNLAMMVSDFCPPGREKQLALTQLEQAVMWANAAIAREQELKYQDQVEKPIDGKGSFTAVRYFPALDQSVRVNVDAKDLALPIGQGLGADQINRRVLALAAPGLEQATNDLKIYVRDHPDAIGRGGTLEGTIDSPSNLGAKTTTSEDSISRR